MPRGPITKYEMESHLHKLKDELHHRDIDLHVSKHLAEEYLNKVLDKLQEFRY